MQSNIERLAVCLTGCEPSDFYTLVQVDSLCFSIRIVGKLKLYFADNTDGRSKTLSLGGNTQNLPWGSREN
jgi:hypothetical protein